MKIRNGFVSNSSSCAFIVDDPRFKTTFELAEEMIRIREWETDDSLVAQMKEAVQKSSIDPRINVTFNTCNYETYIVWCPETKVYAVSTCNNHDFWYLSGGSNVPKEITDVGIDDHEEMEFGLSKHFWFWDLESDMYIKISEKYETCHENDHWADLAYINGDETKPQCPKCYAIAHPNRTYSESLIQNIIEKNREIAKNRKRNVNFRI